MKRALKFIALIWLLLGFAFGLPKEQMKSSFAQTLRRPNIVFVLTDDQMPGTERRMRALQNNVVSKGVRFSNTVSTYPLCCPGRATIQRGQYAHNTKIYGNSLPLAKGTVASWPRTAVLSERETNLEPPQRWEALRTRTQKYVRFENGETENYDLIRDPYEINSNPDAVERTASPDWEQRLDDLHGCKGTGCRSAENGPLP
jgi:hypothetical protein